MNEVLIAISGGEGGLRALERPTMLPNHPVVRGGCSGGSAPQHDAQASLHRRMLRVYTLAFPFWEGWMWAGGAHPHCWGGWDEERMGARMPCPMGTIAELMAGRSRVRAPYGS